MGILSGVVSDASAGASLRAALLQAWAEDLDNAEANGRPAWWGWVGLKWGTVLEKAKAPRAWIRSGKGPTSVENLRRFINSHLRVASAERLEHYWRVVSNYGDSPSAY